jgi:hypothetical protein
MSSDTNRVKKIGKYEILDILGRGGMGVVYKAIDPSIGRLVAIKRITGNYADDPKFLQRFFREAKSTGKLQHQNIVIVHDLGDLDGTPFLVMEFLEGESLDSIIKEERPLPIVEKLNLIVQVCNGLQYAHERNVIHRDIKPANLMLLKSGLVKIVDFGIARIEDDMHMTMPSQVLGTFQYMSKEQINNEPLDGRTDVYSTAVVLYQLLTFHLPFEGRDTGATLLKIINDPPPPLSQYIKNYPPELDGIVQRALAKSKDERYQTAEEFALDLMQVQEQFRVEIAAQYLRGAEDALSRGELSKAKEQCMEILRFERQGSRTGIPLHEAKQLLQQVQQLIQRQQRSDQAQQLRSQAQEAMSAQQYERALGYASQAVQLDPENADLAAYRDSINEAKTRDDRHREAVKKAQSAHYAGDLTEALHEIEQAILYDSADTDAQALRAEITHEIEQRRRQVAVQGLVQEAQRQISSRQFTAALEALQKAETVDPSAPGLHELMALASNGRKQEIRRKELERFSSAITDALNQDDFAVAMQTCDEALAQFPEDRGLVKLKAMAERRKEAAEKRRFIEDQVAGARKLLDNNQAEVALQNLEVACAKYPNEPALTSVLTIVQQTLRQERDDARKNDYLRRAKDALKAKQFQEAVQALEEGCAEFDAPELQDLLQFAREESAAFDHARKVEAAANTAHQLMSQDQHEQAIDFLRATLVDLSDEELSILLAEAERHVEDFNRRVNECVETAEKLLRVDRVTEAVRFLDSQEQDFAKSPRFTEVSTRARECEQRLQRINAAVQSAASALAVQDWDAAQKAIDECRCTSGEHPELARLATQIVVNRSASATAAVTKATQDCRTLFLARSYEAAIDLLDGVAGDLEYVPEDLRLRYTALHEEAERGVAWTQQQAAFAREKYEDRAPDTAERTSWDLDATTRGSTNASAMRKRDLDELQQLAEESSTTGVLDELASISARARVLAERHAGDSQVESTARQVFNTASARSFSLTATQFGVPGQTLPRQPMVPAPQNPPLAAPPVTDKPADRPAESIAIDTPAAPAPPAIVEASASASESSIIEPISPPVALPAQPADSVSPANESPLAPAAVVAPTPERHEAAAPEIRPEELPAELQGWGQNLVSRVKEPLPSVSSPNKPATSRPLEPKPMVPVPKPSEPEAAEPKLAESKPSKRSEGRARDVKAIFDASPPKSPESKPRDRKVVVPPVHAKPASPKAGPAVAALGSKMPVFIAGGAAAVLVLGFAAWKFWSGTTNQNPSLLVAGTPAGVTIQVQDQTCVTPNCQLQLAPGDYELRASLAGYKSETHNIHVAAGTPLPALSLALQPLPTTVHVSTNFNSGEITLDGKKAGSLIQGSFEIPNVSPGEHKLRVSSEGVDSEISFAARVGNAPELKAQNPAQNISAFAVSSVAGKARLLSNIPDGARVSIDDHIAGSLAGGQQDLGALSEGSHRIQIGEGEDATSHTVRVSAFPALDLFLNAESNVGILVVQSKTPAAAVFLDGRQSGITDKDGVYRAALPAKKISVRLSKSGFHSLTQSATLNNKNETALTFDLQPIVQNAKLSVNGLLIAMSVSVDGQEVGVTGSSGQFTTEVPPGDHVVEFSKNGFQSKQANITFTSGETKRLNAQLIPNAPPQSEARNRPPESVKTPVTKPQEPPPVREDKPSQPPVKVEKQLPPPAVKPDKPQAQASPDQQEWARVKDTRDPAMLEAFLTRYPASPFADQGRERLRGLQTSSDRAAISLTLRRFADAYQHRSVDELESIWPSLDKDSRKKFTEAFKSAQSVQASVQPDGDPVVSGDNATISCDRSVRFTFNGEEKPISDRIVINLKRKSGTWLIDSVRASK